MNFYFTYITEIVENKFLKRGGGRSPVRRLKYLSDSNPDEKSWGPYTQSVAEWH